MKKTLDKGRITCYYRQAVSGETQAKHRFGGVPCKLNNENMNKHLGQFLN